MKSWFAEQPRTLIGVVHLQPLPGSPRYEGAFGRVVAAAVRDARAYERGGAHAVCIENFGDVPFTKGAVAPETVAALAVAGQAVRAAIKLPIGFNVLRNDARAALALCAVCDGRFIRINVHTGAMVTDQGVIEGQAYETLRCRRQLCPEVLIFADLHVKHATPLGGPLIAISARDTLYRGLADALIVSGTGTGLAANVADLQAIRAACPSAKVLVGSGVRIENVQNYLPLADGFIVGTSLKTGGQISNAVAVRRVAALAAALQGARHLKNRGPGHD